jgi:hypothetical protein
MAGLKALFFTAIIEDSDQADEDEALPALTSLAQGC